MFAHTFRFDDVVHVVVTSRRRVRRGRGARVICGPRVPIDATRVTSRAAISCDSCSRSFTGFVDIMDMDFGFVTHDDGTGRFA